MCFLDRVYKTLIISTIVDGMLLFAVAAVYKTLIISTIVDKGKVIVTNIPVYKTLIISTIVDSNDPIDSSNSL